MFLRSIAYSSIQSTIFRGNTIRNATIKRGMAKDVEKVCQKPCPPSTTTCTDKLKFVQARFQKDDPCPIWLKSTKDKLMYLTTVGLALTGIGLTVYNFVLRVE